MAALHKQAVAMAKAAVAVLLLLVKMPRIRQILEKVAMVALELPRLFLESLPLTQVVVAVLVIYPAVVVQAALGAVVTDIRLQQQARLIRAAVAVAQQPYQQQAVPALSF